MKYFFLCLLFTIQAFAQPAHPPPRPNQPIAVEALRADFRLIRASLEELHPSLYRYTPKDSLNTAFDRVYASLKVPLTEQEFMIRLYPLISQIRCGHTQIEHSTAYKQFPDRPRAISLPFQVLVVQNNRLFVTQNRSTDNSLKPGTEILRINGIEVNELIGETRQQWSSDGYNLSWVEFFINNYGLLNEITTFLHGWRGTYTLNVRRDDGTLHTTTVTSPPPTRPVDTSQIRQQIIPIKPAHSRWEPKPYLSLRLMPADSATALLTVNALEYGDETFYRQAFEQLKKRQIQHLILDIRRNHGGDARIISQLMAYLADAPFVLLKSVEGTLASPDRNRFRPYFDKAILDSHRTSFSPGIRQGNVYSFAFRPENGRITGYLPLANANRFRGTLYVLTDGGTFSNGANFAASLKAQRANTLFVGRETGGTEAGCNGGTVQRLTLPHSQLQLQFPWLRLTSASTQPDNGYGLRPDIPVLLSPLALANRRDEDLEAVLKLIQTANKKP